MMSDFDSMDCIKRRTRLEFKCAKAMVLHILEKSVRSRNDDKWLILKSLEVQGMDLEVIDKDSGTISWMFTVDDLMMVKAFETVTRCRREIQNRDGRFLPTDPQVIHKRRIREVVIKQYYGEQSREYKEWEGIKYGVC